MEKENECDEVENWNDAREEHEQTNLSTIITKMNLSDDHRSGIGYHPSSSSAYSSVHSESCRSSPPLNPERLHNSSLSLHEAIFKNDACRIYDILSDEEAVKNVINEKDKHGNTPLHLACMLGRSKDIVSALLKCGASVDSKNLNRWTPFHEACSYGNRDIIRILTKQIKDEVYDILNKNKLAEKLEKTKNYKLTLKWEFLSWIPLIARALPNDTCVINKQGKNIRIDTKLLDLELNYWKPNNRCLIYSNKFEKKWVIVNNTAKKYQYLEPEKMEKDIEDKVDDFMSIDILDYEVKSASIKLVRSTSGWIWKSDKVEKVGKYDAAVYNFNNLILITRKRREHLTETDLKLNKMAFKSVKNIFQFGQKPSLKETDENLNQDSGSDDDNNEDGSSTTSESRTHQEVHRESLEPPPPRNVTWEQYFNSEPGKHPILGRELKCKNVETAFKASVAMSEQFPLRKSEFLDLLSIVPIKLFKNLKEFIEMKLPDGFPIRVDIPIFHFLMARITLEDFEFLEGPIDESLFAIPDNYQEDSNLFPILGGGGRSHRSKRTR